MDDSDWTLVGLVAGVSLLFLGNRIRAWGRARAERNRARPPASGSNDERAEP